MRAIEDGSGHFLGIVRTGLVTEALDRIVGQEQERARPNRVVLCDEEGRLLARLAPEDPMVEQADESLRVEPSRVPQEIAQRARRPQLATDTPRPSRGRRAIRALRASVPRQLPRPARHPGMAGGGGGGRGRAAGRRRAGSAGQCLARFRARGERPHPRRGNPHVADGATGPGRGRGFLVAHAPVRVRPLLAAIRVPRRPGRDGGTGAGQDGDAGHEQVRPRGPRAPPLPDRPRARAGGRAGPGDAAFLRHQGLHDPLGAALAGRARPAAGALSRDDDRGHPGVAGDDRQVHRRRHHGRLERAHALRGPPAARLRGRPARAGGRRSACARRPNGRGGLRCSRASASIPTR